MHDGNFYFHGDKVWSGYHPFIKYFNHIPVTNSVDKETWFVGSRPNYTHQLIDFLPNLLFLMQREKELNLNNPSIVIGKMNSTLEACAEVRSVNQALRTKEWIELAELGTPSIIDGLRIRELTLNL